MILFKIFYLFGIKAYVFAISIASIFDTKAKKWLKGRKEQKKFDVSAIKNHRTIWFHVASLGEFEQTRPVIELFRKKFNDAKIVLTFFSPSGYEIKKNYDKADLILYLPADTPKNAKNFIEKINPDIAFFVKYDFWFFYLETLHKKNIPTFIFSAIFRENQIFFKKTGKKYAQVLKFFTHIFVQDEKSKNLLEKSGIKNVTIAGDTRFDRVVRNAEEKFSDTIIEKFKNNELCIIAGSTWQPDEEILFRFASKYNYKIIIAPHEINEAHIKNIGRKFNKKTVFYTKTSDKEASKAQIIVIDTIGILSKIYRYGNIAYIGGGFGTGIHNIAEPAVYGIPVIFGPNYKKFKEAVDLIKLNAAFPVKNHIDFENTAKRLLSNENQRIEAGKKARNYILKNKGASEKILNLVLKHTKAIS